MEKGPVMGKPVKKQPKKIAKIEKGTRNMTLFTSIQLVSKAGIHVKKKEKNWNKKKKNLEMHTYQPRFTTSMSLCKHLIWKRTNGAWNFFLISSWCNSVRKREFPLSWFHYTRGRLKGWRSFIWHALTNLFVFFFLEGINFLLLLTLDSKQKVRGMFFFFFFFFVFDIVSLLSSYALFVKVLC